MNEDGDVESGPFYHGTKADLETGDFIEPGRSSNYGYGKRKSAWVYMSAVLPTWGAELAQGEGPGRIYVVEPTGPFEDDPDLTDKKFAGNPTRSYRSRHPLEIVGEVKDWEGHTPEEIQAMKDGRDRRLAAQAAQIACIPSCDDLDRRHAAAELEARAWRADAEFGGCVLRMVIRGAEIEVLDSRRFRSGEEAIWVDDPRTSQSQPRWPGSAPTLSGRISEVSAWQDGWAGTLESCVTEIGLSTEATIWMAVDAESDTITFRVDALGRERSWQRNLRLHKGVLVDDKFGELWDYGTTAL